MSKLSYLASPYSHPDTRVRKGRFEVISMVQAKLIAQGEHVYGPITESHTVQMTAHKMGLDISGGWEFWKEHDELLLSKCDELIVVKMEGWQESVGVQAEINFAITSGMPVRYVTVEEILNG